MRVFVAGASGELDRQLHSPSWQQGLAQERA